MQPPQTCRAIFKKSQLVSTPKKFEVVLKKFRCEGVTNQSGNTVLPTAPRNASQYHSCRSTTPTIKNQASPVVPPSETRRPNNEPKIPTFSGELFLSTIFFFNFFSEND